MSCGVSYSGGCGSFFSLPSCGIRSDMSSCGRPSSCGGGSIASEYSKNLRNFALAQCSSVARSSEGCPTGCGIAPCSSDAVLSKTKEVYVYDINLDKNEVSCLVRTTNNGYARYEQENVGIDKLRKFVKKGDFNFRELVGISVKKDGSFKLKPKELKPYADLLKEKIPHFKEHYNHMKEVKQELKEEREREEDFER